MNKTNFTKPLLTWYNNNQRDLPWRQDTDPYHIWVSEIMLQQTRVEAVIGYYQRFLEKYPTIKDLANADIDELYKVWQGLGYYRRAYNMKVAAQQIMQKYQGVFPTTKEEISQLKGIGDYTSSAIASISFGEKTPAIDGNLLRIWARVTKYPDNILTTTAKNACYQFFLPLVPSDAGNFNQALMDLGATVCIPTANPKCQACPLKALCLGQNEADTYPIRITKTTKKEYQYTILILKHQEKTVLVKRTEKGVLSNMYAFPTASNHLALNDAIQYVENHFGKIKDLKQSFYEKHVFTHQIWHMLVYEMDIIPNNEILVDYVEQYAIPTAFQKCYDRTITHQQNK